MAWRPIASVVIGLALWWFLFFAIGIGFGSLWPQYQEAARLMFQEGDLSGFITPMLFLNLLLFVVAGLVVGGFASFIGRTRVPALILASLFLIYMVINHYILEWDQLPPWYNLIVPLIVSGSIILGSRLIRSSSANDRTTGFVSL
jgi:hypothetical protein